MIIARLLWIVTCCMAIFLVPTSHLLTATAGGADAHGEWPFSTPVRPDLPAVSHGDWVVNPIDAFVLEKLDRKGLTANHPANKLSLLRRVTFDLTGLPPTPAEQQAFLQDDTPGGYARLVERLLASPRFGERWAQHWLDVVRYAETEGFKADRLRPLAYQYRDYVIRSVNSDRPYDQFVQQQIAGDELQPDDPQAIIATGLNRLYPDENNAANLFQRREEILTDLTETTGLALMGLTMGCAQCHDHKFDDILQTDFYRLRAFFAGMIENDNALAASAQERRAYAKQLQVWEERTADIRQETSQLLAAARAKSDEYNLQKFRKEIQQCVSTPQDRRTPLQEQIAQMALRQLGWRFDPKKAVKELPEEKAQRYRDLQTQLAEFDELRPKPLPTAMAIGDVGPQSPPTYRFANGNWQTPEEKVEPGFPEFLGDADYVIPAAIDQSQTTGRRAALALWLTSAENPLTARVIVNRLWQHHFGRGIVATPNDFGAMGDAPTHRELLDWLAVELVESGWSLKHLHRLMVTSATYRQSSRVDPDDSNHAKALATDPGNDLLWHARRHRLEGEAIRDSMLQVAGQLNHQMYGSSSRPPLPAGVSKRYAWKADDEVSHHYRRSIFVFVKRNMRFPLFDAFDLPDLHQSCGTRSTTVSALQALLLLNSDLTRQMARQWADNLMDACEADLRSLVESAYVQALGREPDLEEVAAAVAFLSQQAATIIDDSGPDQETVSPASAQRLAVTDFCQSLLNANEFLYID